MSKIKRIRGGQALFFVRTFPVDNRSYDGFFNFLLAPVSENLSIHAGKNALKSVKLSSLRVICSRKLTKNSSTKSRNLTDVCMMGDKFVY